MTRLTSLLLVALLCCACSNELDETPNKLLVDKAEGPCADLMVAGDWYRFTLLKVETISGATQTLVDLLNGLWSEDIIKRELNILVEVVEVRAQDVTLRMYSGARTSSGDIPTLCTIGSTAVDLVMPITDAGLGEQASPASMNIYAGSKAAPKNCATDGRGLNAIPVTNALVSAACDADTGLVSGIVNGALGKAALAATCACVTIGSAELSEFACGTLDATGVPSEDDPCANCLGVKEDGAETKFQNLMVLLPTLNGGDLEWPETTDDGGEAASVTASFNAEKMDDVPASCE
jgi:hypothetical protein